MQNTQEYRETSCHACLTRSCDVRPRDVSGAVIWTSKFRRSYQHISNPLPSVCRLRRTQPDLITPEYDHLLQMSHTDTHHRTRNSCYYSLKLYGRLLAPVTSILLLTVLLDFNVHNLIQAHTLFLSADQHAYTVVLRQESVFTKLP